MKIVHCSEITPTIFNNETAKGVAARVVIGKEDGANNFCMRVFELAAGGNTPMHTHEWEHEMFYHAGHGEVFCDGKWNQVRAGSVVFIPGSVEHQVRNTGADPLIIVCLVPSFAPEL